MYNYITQYKSKGEEAMTLKAVIFDIGQTLVYYPIPLNWSALYRPAFERISEKYGLILSEEEYKNIGDILSKYNTRINPRDREISSDIIFGEIIDTTNIHRELIKDIKEGFYKYFRNDSYVYEDAVETLGYIRSKGKFTGTFSDVAYGMDNKYALEDLGTLIRYVDIPFTSNDVGYRKPNPKGLIMLANKLGITPSEMIFVGDEKKDIDCAKNAGSVSVLINRSDENIDNGQDYTIHSLNELISLI